MLRVRATAFLAGFAVASAAAMYQLQKEVWTSHRTLAAQAQGYHSDLESRIVWLEKSSGVQMDSKKTEESDVSYHDLLTTQLKDTEMQSSILDEGTQQHVSSMSSS